MVIDMYKTGFAHPGDLPFEDLSVTGSGLTSSNTSLKTDNAKGTVTGRSKRRTGLRALFNTTKVISYEHHCLFCWQ